MSDKIRLLIVDDLQETRESIRKLLQFEPDIEVIAQAGTGEQAVAVTRQQQPDVVLMDINMPGGDGISASRSITQASPATQVVIMSVQSESDYLRRAMLAGARDFLIKPFSGDELVSAIRRVYKMRPVVPPPMPENHKNGVYGGGRLAQLPPEGAILAVFSPKGGSGCTTIATNLAVALAALGHRTLLMDGSFQFGNVDVMLNLKPTTSVADLVERLKELDGDLVSSVTITHESGLRVLLAPPRPEMAELIGSKHVETLLPALRRQFDFVVVDTTSSLNDVTLAILDAADRILLVAGQTLPNLKNISRFYDVADQLNYNPQKITLIVNVASSKASITTKDISEILKRPVAATLPADAEVAETAADRGQALVIGPWQKRPLSLALGKLAQTLAEEIKPKPQFILPGSVVKSSRLTRLFGSK
ncbi:MAG: response regulator [Chloroflexota bacterium]